MVDADDLTGAYGLPVPIDEEYLVPDQVEGEVDTMNRQLVGQLAGDVVVGIPNPRMTPDEALIHAAWLVAVAEHDASHSFAEVLEAVRNT